MYRFQGLAALSVAAACVFTTPFLATAQAGSGATLTVLPVRASGIECATPDQDPMTCDWFIAGVAMILNRGGQNVEFEFYARDWDTDQIDRRVEGYQIAPLCSSFYSNTGIRLLPIDTDCTIGQGEFGEDFCIGVDEDHSDWIFSTGGTALSACNVNNANCPDGANGMFACGSVLIAGAGGIDDGTDQYLTTFAYTVPTGAAGMWSLMIDPNPDNAFLLDSLAKQIPVTTVNPGIVSVRCANDAQCDDGNPCTNDICNQQANICQNPPKEVGAACGDPTSTECNGPDTCDANLICQDNMLEAGTPCGACEGGAVCDNEGNCGDGQITLDDYANLYDCGTGPVVSALDDCCMSFDDGDSDVDLQDIADFFNAFTGE